MVRIRKKLPVILNGILGTVSACGLANSMNLPTTVAPFILRGVTLAGIDCVYLPTDRRVAAYELLSKHLTSSALDIIGQNEIVGLDAVPDISGLVVSQDYFLEMGIHKSFLA